MARGKYARAAARRREDADVQEEIDGLRRQVADLQKTLERTQAKVSEDATRYRNLIDTLAVERDAGAGPAVQRQKDLAARASMRGGYEAGKWRGQAEYWKGMWRDVCDGVQAHFVREHGMSPSEALAATRRLEVVDDIRRLTDGGQLPAFRLGYKP